jgi:hypothetical protein
MKLLLGKEEEYFIGRKNVILIELNLIGIMIKDGWDEVVGGDRCVYLLINPVSFELLLQRGCCSGLKEMKPSLCLTMASDSFTFTTPIRLSTINYFGVDPQGRDVELYFEGWRGRGGLRILYYGMTDREAGCPLSIV